MGEPARGMAALAPESLGETGGCQDLSYDSSLLFRCAVVHGSAFSDRLGRTAKTPSHDPDTDFCVCLTTDAQASASCG
jgi:hypothetical protein